jgi:homoserine dehydrogenase
VDVARKALILARGLGWRLNLEDVEVQGLYPADMDGLTVAEFMDALPRLDEEFQMRVAEAQSAGKVLRFAAQVEAQGDTGVCRVGPTLVSAASPLGRLSGTDNLVEFTTRWYNPNPLVVQGRGAGTDATAAGVLSDIVELAYTA